MISCIRVDKGKSNSSKSKNKSYEIEMNSKPRREQGGLGLLSHTISVQSLQESIPKVLILERRGRNRERRERAPGEEAAAVLCLAPGREEKGRGYLRCPRRGPKYP